ncbi:rhodanese-like domain-containing protein [Streptomyces sp. BI20]|uniref:rhodanese-like domain-containing protein n=1 Tax=Streptomyces sp. BI20 TaxID=3403460 RepID=UPI003C791F4F
MNFGSVPTVGVDALTPESFLLDVRENDEWTAGHAQGALHIPMSEFVPRFGELTEALPDGATVHVLCRVGGRSAQVTQYLVGQGIDAVNVAGGMQDWEARGREVVVDGGGAGVVI